MADTPSIRVVKKFQYRGATTYFSNRYHFNGGTPADSAAWYAFMDAIVLKEKTMFTDAVTITACTGFASGSDVPVASKAYTTAGTLAVTGYSTPGDCAAVLRHSTSKRSTNDHPVYVHSFFHGARAATDVNYGDTLAATQKTAIENYGGSWRDGITAGGITAVRATPDGHAVVGMSVDPYIGHRDFPR